jgi:hypothetical protein
MITIMTFMFTGEEDKAVLQTALSKYLFIFPFVKSHVSITVVIKIINILYTCTVETVICDFPRDLQKKVTYDRGSLNTVSKKIKFKYHLSVYIPLLLNIHNCVKE